MNNKILFLFIVSAIFFSCKKSEDKKDTTVYTSFNKTVALKSEKYQTPPTLLYPRNMFLMDSVLAIYNDKMDTLFQVFDKKTLAYKYSFGIKGGGPNDFQLLSSYLVSSNGHEAVVQDLSLLKKISLKNGYPSVTTLPVPAKQQYYNGMVQLKDSVLLCNADFSDKESFMFIYPDGKTEKWGDYPESAERFGGDVAAMKDAYAFYTVARPEGDRFAAFYAYRRQFRIFSSTGELLKDVTLNIPPFEEKVSVDAEKRYIHTIAMFATNDYIYALNLDMTGPEIYEQKQFPSIQVFSWDGEPLMCYKLDCMISCFTVDEASRTIYGAFVENEEAIYTFKME